MPLQAIFPTLPAQVQPRVKPGNTSALTVSLPLDIILPQLSRGAVQIPFGTLRKAAPGAFSPEADCDDAMITLPLPEVISRLDPNLIPRRRSRKKLEVPEDIEGPFRPRDGKQVPAAEPSPRPAEVRPDRNQPRPPPSQPAMPSAPAPRFEQTPQPARKPLPPSTPLQQPVVARQFEPTPPAAPAPAPMIKPPAGEPIERLRLIPRGPASEEPAPAVPAYSAPPAAPSAPAPLPPPPPPAPAISPIAPVSQPVVAEATPAPEVVSGCLMLSLGTLTAGWPESLRLEIGHLNINDSKVALPLNEVEQGLRRGRLAFSWRTLRGWMKPACPATASARDGLTLELPLGVVAPAFMARQKPDRTQRKVTVDDSIPDVFVGRAPVQVDASTPEGVVNRCMALKGVAGVIVVSSDGLAVAASLPNGVNRDKLAACVTQIFTRMSQTTNELAMGQLRHVIFMLERTPWQIFRTRNLFFAVQGCPDESLPTVLLAELAGELDKSQ